MIIVEIKKLMHRGTTKNIQWEPIEVNMTLEDYKFMRSAISKTIDDLYPTFSPLNLTASGFAMDLMAAIGWINKNDDFNMRKIAYKIIHGRHQPFAPSIFQYIATHKSRVTHVDGVKLKRRKCFDDMTYSKWNKITIRQQQRKTNEKNRNHHI